MIHRANSFRAVSLVATLALGYVSCSGSSSPSTTGGGGGGSSAGKPGSGGSGVGGSANVGGSEQSGSGLGSDSAGGAAAGNASLGGSPLGGSGGHGEAGETTSPVINMSAPMGRCGSVTTEYVLATGIHVTACMPIVYATNPPSSGEHYPTWADFGEYDFPLPRGYWMHNLEHGAVVVSYHCSAGCADDLAAARAWLATLVADAGCETGSRARVLLVPDPELDVAWAASAWGHTLRADCFDAEVFSSFYLAHAGQPPAPEAGLCGSGFDFRVEGADTCGAK